MMSLPYRSACLDCFRALAFTGSAPTVKDLPFDQGQEIALVGHANVGKSSLINALAQRKRLARYSKQPGRTQALNLFSFQSPLPRRLVDLPGYGYAQISKLLKARWDKALANYFSQHTALTDILWVFDIRRDFTEIDKAVLDLVHKRKRKVHLVLNKVDKLSAAQTKRRIGQLQAQTDNFRKQQRIEPRLWLVSTKTGLGIDELREALGKHLQLDTMAKKDQTTLGTDSIMQSDPPYRGDI